MAQVDYFRISGYKELKENKDFFKERLKYVILIAKKEYFFRNGKYLTDEELSRKGGITRFTLNRWLKGEDFPREQRLSLFCNGLEIDPMMFTVTNLLTPEEQIKITNQCRAVELGINESFVQFLHDEGKLYEQIGEMIHESVDGYTGIQFPDKSGNMVYPDKITALIIKNLQIETIKLITTMINDINNLRDIVNNSEHFENHLIRLLNNKIAEQMKEGG